MKNIKSHPSFTPLQFSRSFFLKTLLPTLHIEKTLLEKQSIQYLKNCGGGIFCTLWNPDDPDQTRRFHHQITGITPSPDRLKLYLYHSAHEVFYLRKLFYPDERLCGQMEIPTHEIPAGKTLLTTLNRDYSKSEACNKLMGSGVNFINFPFISFCPIKFMIPELTANSMLLFTSARTVEFLESSLSAPDLEKLKAIPGVSVGNQTEKCLIEKGFRIIHTAQQQSLRDALHWICSQGDKSENSKPSIIFFGAQERVPIPEKFSSMRIHPVNIYQTIGNKVIFPFSRLLTREQIDTIIFSSPSNVRFFFEEQPETTQKLRFVPFGLSTRDALILKSRKPWFLPGCSAMNEILKEVENRWKSRPV